MCVCVCGACMCVSVTKHTCHYRDCGSFIIPHFNWQILFKTNIAHPHTRTPPHTSTHTQTLQQSNRQLNRKPGVESIPHPPLNDIPLNVFLLFRKKVRVTISSLKVFSGKCALICWVNVNDGLNQHCAFKH